MREFFIAQRGIWQNKYLNRVNLNLKENYVLIYSDYFLCFKYLKYMDHRNNCIIEYKMFSLAEKIDPQNLINNCLYGWCSKTYNCVDRNINLALESAKLFYKQIVKNNKNIKLYLVEIKEQPLVLTLLHRGHWFYYKKYMWFWLANHTDALCQEINKKFFNCNLYQIINLKNNLSSQLVPHVQPVMHNNKVFYYELLIRGKDGESAHSVLQNLNTHADLDVFNLNYFVNHFNKFKIPVAINVDINIASNLKFVSMLLNFCKQYINFNNLLIIEITEYNLLKNFIQLYEFVKKIQSLGIKIALDDFGSGNLSFFHIEKLQPNVVKIDKRMVQNLDKEYESCFVKTLLALQKKLNFTLIAEGVENENTKNNLEQNFNIHHMQGYFFCKPFNLKLLF